MMQSRSWARYVTRCAVRFILLMFAVSAVVFLLVASSPIDPVQANTGQAALLSMSASKRAQIAARWGVGTPVWQRYLTWLAAALHGDFGTSLRFNAPVIDVVSERFASSFALMFSAWVISGLLGITLGIVAGVHRDTLADKAIKSYSYVLSATPSFWLALVVLMVFAVRLHWFPMGFSYGIGASAASVTLTERAYHLVLPALTLSVTGVANIALHTREKVIDVMNADYVRFARTRGESDLSIVLRHGLRNLLIPAITLQCASIGEIFGGSVLVEQVFSYPGLGQAAVTAGLGGDAPLLVGIALASACFVFVGNGLANILYGVLDPQMKGGVAHVE